MLLRRERDGSLVTHADLSGLSATPGTRSSWTVAATPTSTASASTSRPASSPPGIIALVTPDGSVRQVADGIAFPNGMAVTPDNSTLIVAESYGNRLTAFDIAADGSLSNRRVWADLGDGVPDGICLDAEGAVWYGDVPNKRCVRVREGGEVLQTIDARPRLLRLHARRRGRQDAVPGGERMGWPGEHGRRGANGPGAHRPGAGPGRRLAVGAQRARSEPPAGGAEGARFAFPLLVPARPGRLKRLV